MLRLLFIASFTFSYFLSISQIADFITVRKKNGRLIKTFITGSPVIFQTINKEYINGWISNIKNDSVFVKIFDRKIVMTNWGFTAVDTAAVYVRPVYYKDIRRIKIYYRRRFIRSKIDRILISVGAIYFITNIVNGAYQKQSVTETGNLQRLGISLAAIGTGFLMRKKVIDADNHFSTRRHKIEYIHIQ